MKYTFPPEFEKLTPDQIAQVNAWLDEFPYRIVHQKLLEHFGIKISDNKLCRYTQNMEIADDLSDEEHQFDVKDIYALLNAQKVPYDDATLHLVARKTFEHALTREISVSKLVTLHRLATYKQRLELDQRRLAINEAKFHIQPSKRQQQPSSSPSVASSRPPGPTSSVRAVQTATPPLSEGEWTALLTNRESNKPERNSIPTSAAERLIASQVVLFPDTLTNSLLTPPVSKPIPKDIAHLTKELPSDPIPLPRGSSRSFPLAA